MMEWQIKETDLKETVIIGGWSCQDLLPKFELRIKLRTKKGRQFVYTFVCASEPTNLTVYQIVEMAKNQKIKCSFFEYIIFKIFGI